MKKSKTVKYTGFLVRVKWLQAPLEKYVFPLVLLFWPLVCANQGISLMDTTYSLANYTYPDGVSHMWFFATFLANVAGSALVRLPWGGTLLSMNIMTALLVSVTALAAYYILKRMIAGWMVFLGEFLAQSLCWCPTVILYNYLTYFLLTLGTLFLFRGISAVPGKALAHTAAKGTGRNHPGSKDPESGSRNGENGSRDPAPASSIYGRHWYILAGICLGLNVTVKVSNLEYVALILALWFWCAVTRQKFKGYLMRTLYCIAGFLVGFCVPVLLAAMIYGPASYFSMIPELLGATGNVDSYTAGGMVSAILSSYGHSLRWFFILIPCTLVGVAWFSLPLFDGKGRRLLQWAVYLAGMALVLKFFHSRGMFTTNYQDYWCMFEWGMLLLILCWIFLVLAMIEPPFLRSGGGADERFLAAAVAVQLLILPLGSNNYTFPILNCLFIIAPFTIWMLRRLWQETRHARPHFAWHAMAMMILVMTLLQGGLFHMNFAFRDGTDGQTRSVQMSASQNQRAAGMYTTKENADRITSLTAFLDAYQDPGDRKAGGSGEDTGQNKTTGSAIVFGNVPGIHYLCNLPPALDTTWPDLDSYPTASFAAGLQKLSDAGESPLVIIHYEETPQSVSSAGKYDILVQYMQEHDYQSIYQEGDMEIFQCAAGDAF